MSAETSSVPFRTAVGRRRIDALEPAIIHTSSSGLGWNGVSAEIGSHNGWFVDDLVVDGYYLAVNLDDTPLAIESRERGRFVRKLVPPGAMVIHAYGDSFSFRVPQHARWAGVVLAPSIMRNVCDERLPDCDAQFGATDATLLNDVASIVRQMQLGKGRALAATQAAVSLASNLAAHPAASSPQHVVGGLSLLQLRRVADFIETHLADDIDIGRLASVAGLSLWHFARAFKISTRVTPHQFVINRRLALGRELLHAKHSSIAVIAIACGFADQAHFSRSFQARHGLTPGEYRRRARL